MLFIQSTHATQKEEAKLIQLVMTGHKESHMAMHTVSPHIGMKNTLQLTGTTAHANPFI